jgi:hypothetical protein
MEATKKEYIDKLRTELEGHESSH